VVRPPNHQYLEYETPRTWCKKSTAQCPTYGSCEYRMKCGPVDEYCDKCGNGEEGRYLVPFHNGHTMDSITIAEIMNTGHKRARANRTQAWIRTPMRNVRTDCFVLALQRKCNKTLTKEEQTEILHKIYGVMPN
jgi:tRNA G26 N,N-dimethylase Trm1